MKMIVITQDGHIQGFAHGSKADHAALHAGKAAKPAAGLRLLPGQEMHEVEVPDEFEKIVDGHELHDRLTKLMRKH